MSEDHLIKNTNRNISRWTQILFFINAGIWFVFSVKGLLAAEGSFGLPVGAAWFISALMAVNGVVLLAFGVLLPRCSRFITFSAAAYIALNAVLSITDEVGLFDYLVLALNLVLLVLLLFEIKSVVSESSIEDDL